MTNHRIRLELEIPFSGGWRSGSGEGSNVVDRLIRYDARGMPFIPGSTVKGVIRESCEKLSRTLRFFEPIDPHRTELKGSDAFIPLRKANSPVVRLFGNKYEEGGLFFRDARPKEPAYPLHYFRPRTRMNRRLGTVRDKHLFTTQYANPMTLSTVISGFHRNLASLEQEHPPFAYALLIASIRMIDRIGGDKSTGGGYLADNIAIESIVYNDQRIPVAEYLQETLPFYLSAEDYKEMREE